MRAEKGEFLSGLGFWHTQTKMELHFFRREKASLTLVSKEWHKCWVNGKTKCNCGRGNAERGGRGAEFLSGSVTSHAASQRGLGGLSPVSDVGEPLSGHPLTNDVSHCQPESMLGAKV